MAATRATGSSTSVPSEAYRNVIALPTFAPPSARTDTGTFAVSDASGSTSCSLR